MKQFLIFIGGMIAGAMLLYVMGFRSESSIREQFKHEFIQRISKNLENLDQEADVQYIEVKGRKGNVELRTGMP
jgi:hypothetical protein